MPYIPQQERQRIGGEIDGFTPQNGGELQYAIATMIQAYYHRVCDDGPRYANMEEIMGALDGAAREHYRVVVAPYEDHKMAQDGSVYQVKHSKEY